ncbi:unnamed protein product [Didymodactylos carnosus]|uniref:Uncharacterized protein n=1 Tax=Didymodactylos carnosus TaxID=1234261 RepID=A0A813UXC8_9BILA|nr:unnamed protein product [Didymodactylos carnosus]CAF0908165.1 unnamed protein product [Didymodactylos carnosus]CAF3620783.1 unnamed protein product [Didymodactylos carnosus]CAF3687659.1 unnamed protein product [Didymodactylos carnosus]
MNLSYPISSFEIKPLTTFENLHQLQQLSTSNNIISDRNKTVSSGYEPYRFDNQCQIISQQHVNLVDHFSPPACSNEKSNNTVITTALDFNPKSNALLPQRDTLNQCSKSAVQPPLKKISSSYHNIDNQDNIPYRPSPQFASLTLSSVGQKHQQHLPLPIQFQNGTQSLRHPVSTHAHHRSIQSIYYNNNRNQHNVKSAYPSTFTVQPIHYTSYSHNIDQQQQQTPKCTFIMLPPHYLRSTALHENPANV